MEAKLDKQAYKWKVLSKELIDSIVERLRCGSTKRLAARCNRISESILYDWIDQGILDL